MRDVLKIKFQLN